MIIIFMIDFYKCYCEPDEMKELNLQWEYF